jgi:hypothetical protein
MLKRVLVKLPEKSTPEDLPVDLLGKLKSQSNVMVDVMNPFQRFPPLDCNWVNFFNQAENEIHFGNSTYEEFHSVKSVGILDKEEKKKSALQLQLDFNRYNFLYRQRRTSHCQRQ